MLWRQSGAPLHPDSEEVAQPLPSAVYNQWLRGLSADATVLDLLDSGCLRALPPHCHSAVKPRGAPVQKCPLFPIRKERTDREHTRTAYRATLIHQYTPHASGPTVLYS